jgi:nanoRNase/pAp phosphatase (c-di-AMP/oligoRNAs hydrolase)
MIRDVMFAHPKDMQDGKVKITGSDITTNLPYVKEAYLVFDHHASEVVRVDEKSSNYIIDPNAPSAARVVYNYYGGKQKFLDVPDDLMAAVDKADSAQYTMIDVLHPKGWELLSFIMDARTGLGRFKNFRISNYDLMMNLIGYCQNYAIDTILNFPDVKERVSLYFQHEEKFKEQLKRCATVHKNIVVIDLRNEEVIYAGNRFVVYALFPERSVSIHILWGLKKQNISLAVGKSIFNRTSSLNIGELLLKYGGGGHIAAGACQVDPDKVDTVLKELIAKINTDI